MPLTITGATVGYDNGGVNQLMQDIHANMIEEAANQLETNLETLNTAVDEVWVGHSADVFKENMRTDVTKIKEALNKAYDSLSSEISQVVQRMGEVDQELVKNR